MDGEFSKTWWERIHSVHAAAQIAPPLPGVYVYGAVMGVTGLPTRLDWVYVGHSNVLSHRFGNHSELNEKNPQLRDWLRTHRYEAEVWYALMPTPIALSFEKHLIRELQPRFNRIRYTRSPT